MRRGYGDIFTFSGREILQLVASTVVLAAAFSFPLSNSCLLGSGLSGACTGMNWDTFLAVALPVSLILVFAAFVLHELAHKFTAQHYGLWAEFRASMAGLLLALGISGALGLVVAAPGAVVIRGPATKKEAGVISVNGPLVNIVLAVLSFVAWGLTWDSFAFDMSVAGNVFQLSMLINVVLAGFNMIPIKPLDGSKIVRWSVPAFVLTWLVVLGLLWAFFQSPSLIGLT